MLVAASARAGRGTAHGTTVVPNFGIPPGPARARHGDRYSTSQGLPSVAVARDVNRRVGRGGKWQTPSRMLAAAPAVPGPAALAGRPSPGGPGREFEATPDSDSDGCG